MAITTGFLGILLLSFNHLSGGFIFSNSSGISHVSSKGIAEGFVSEKKDGQDCVKIRIAPIAEVNTSEQQGVDKSQPYLADDHNNRGGWDQRDNDRRDNDRRDNDRRDNDRRDNDRRDNDRRDNDR